MPRKVKVFTAAGFRQRGTEPGTDRQQAYEYVAAAGQYGADIVCLPENFYAKGGEVDAEPIPGPTFDRLAELAKKHSLWVVAGFCVSSHARAEGVQNSALVIDRHGELAGRYVKVHPTIGECEDCAIVPGDRATVVETDFGRLGLAICYDIGWPSHWESLAKQGADIVVWPSAYDGGYPLQAYAATHSYYVVSAVRSAHSKLIDINGRVLVASSDWHPFAVATIDLEKELFHADKNEKTLLRLEAEMGDRVTVLAMGEERLFTLESNDHDWPVARIKERFGLENLKDFLARAEQVQDKVRGAQVSS